MKNKTKTYLLLAAVLGIWGVIGYKIINGLSPDDIDEVPLENFDVVFNPKSNTEVDTFSIQNLERDPFLGTLSRKPKTSSSSITQSKNSLTNTITYSGLVKKSNSSEQIFVVNIYNNQYLLKKRQVADSVQLIKGNEKEITIRYQNKNQTIKRQ